MLKLILLKTRLNSIIYFNSSWWKQTTNNTWELIKVHKFSQTEKYRLNREPNHYSCFILLIV